MDEQQRALEDLIRKMQDASATTEDFARANKAAESALMQFSKTTLANVSKGVASFSGSVMSGERSFKSITPVIDALGKAAAGLAKALPLVGNALGKGIEGATAGVNFLVGELDNTLNAFQDISQVGALGAEGLTEFRMMAAESMMSLQKFSQAIQTNSQTLARFGGATFSATQDFTNAIGVIADPQRGFGRRLGLSVNDIADAVGDFMNIQATSGRQQMFTGDALRRGSEAYILQLDTLARLTGRSVKDLRENQMQLLVDQRFAGMASQMEDGGEAILRFISSFPPGLQNAIKDVITSGGVALTQQGQEILLRGPGAIINDLARSVRTETDITGALRTIQGMFKETEDAFAGAAALGIGPTELFGLIKQFSNRLITDGESISKAQDKQVNKQDELVANITDAAGNIDKFNIELENLVVGEGGLNAVAGGLVKLTDVLTFAAGKINEMFGEAGPRTEANQLGLDINQLSSFYNQSIKDIKKKAKEEDDASSIAKMFKNYIGEAEKELALQQAIQQVIDANNGVRPANLNQIVDAFKQRQQQAQQEDGLGGGVGFSQGGIISGPKTGYMAQLHGTEAIVPLPDGDSIPVEVQPSTSTTAPATTGMDNREQMEMMQAQVSRLDEMIRLMGRQISATDKVRTAVS